MPQELNSPQNINYQIAIDGPAGSGKSTIARLLAKKLGLIHIDSGAMYRATTLFILRNNLTNKTKKDFLKRLKNLKINFVNKKTGQEILLNNHNVTQEIRGTEVNKNVSQVSTINFIRSEMVKRQKNLALKNSVVMDGRDIGTTVLPNANLKIYLTADSHIRAERRKKELLKLTKNINMKDLIEQVHKRDNIDSSREISPLAKAQNAIVIDSSNLAIGQVLEEIMLFIPNKK